MTRAAARRPADGCMQRTGQAQRERGSADDDDRRLRRRRRLLAHHRRSQVHVLVVHRTVYGDVTIPKGKVDPGETLPQTAVREIAEETGLASRSGCRSASRGTRCRAAARRSCTTGRPQVSEKAVQRSTFKPNAEIAALEWVTIKRARGYLSYEPDVEILDNFAAARRPGRHRARSRSSCCGTARRRRAAAGRAPTPRVRSSSAA